MTAEPTPTTPVPLMRVVNRLNIGGPTHNVAYLTRYLRPAYDTTLVAGQRDHTEGDSAYLLERLGIHPTVVPNMRRELSRRHDPPAYRHLRRLIRTHQPTILHTHMAKPGALGRLAARREGVPIIVHTFHGHAFHSYFGALKTQFFIQVERQLARISTAIVAISATQKHELANIYRIAPAEKIHVVPNGFDLDPFGQNVAAKRERFRDQWQLANHEVAIGIVGRLVPIKRHDRFLRCFKMAQAATPRRLKAFIVGDGELKDPLLAQARQLGLRVATAPDGDADVLFTSWQHEMDAVFAGMDVVALTSDNEGTPVTLVEALATARPVVATQVGGVQDVVDDEQTGLLYPVRDEPGLAGGLVSLANSPDARHDFGTLGQQRARERYGYRRLVTDMDALYRELLAQKGLPMPAALPDLGHLAERSG